MYVCTIYIHVCVYDLHTCMCVQSTYMYVCMSCIHVCVYDLHTCMCVRSTYMYVCMSYIHVCLYELHTCNVHVLCDTHIYAACVFLYLLCLLPLSPLFLLSLPLTSLPHPSLPFLPRTSLHSLDSRLLAKLSLMVGMRWPCCCGHSLITPLLLPLELPMVTI